MSCGRIDDRLADGRDALTAPDRLHGETCAPCAASLEEHDEVLRALAPLERVRPDAPIRVRRPSRPAGRLVPATAAALLLAAVVFVSSPDAPRAGTARLRWQTPRELGGGARIWETSGMVRTAGGRIGVVVGGPTGVQLEYVPQADERAPRGALGAGRVRSVLAQGDRMVLLKVEEGQGARLMWMDVERAGFLRTSDFDLAPDVPLRLYGAGEDLYLVTLGPGRDPRLAHSADHGKTWTFRENVWKDRLPLHETDPCLAATPGALHLFEDPELPRFRHLISTDRGRTWEEAPAPAPPPAGLGDPVQADVFVREGRLHLFASTTAGAVVHASSADAGRTWTPTRRVGRTGRPGPAVGFPAFDASGDFLAVVASSAAAAPRFFASRDDGRTWSEEAPWRGLRGRPHSFALAVGPDGTVHLATSLSFPAGSAAVVRAGLPSPPAAPLDEAERRAVDRLLEELGHDDPARRAAAEEALVRMGDRLVPALESVLQARAGTEEGGRLEHVLRQLGPRWTGPGPAPDWWEGPR